MLYARAIGVLLTDLLFHCLHCSGCDAFGGAVAIGVAHRHCDRLAHIRRGQVIGGTVGSGDQGAGVFQDQGRGWSSSASENLPPRRGRRV